MNVPSVLPNVANRQHYTCLAPTLPKPHYPLLRTITLASLVKGRWIDGKAQTVALLRFYLRHVCLFYSPNFSAVKTEGLPHHHPSLLTNPSKTALSLAPHQPSQNRTIPRPAPPPLPFNERSVFLHTHYPTRFS